MASGRVDGERDADDAPLAFDQRAARVAGLELAASTNTSRRRGARAVDVGAAGDDLLARCAPARLAQRAAARVAEDARRPSPTSALAASRAAASVEPGDAQHREVAVGIERDDVGVEPRAVDGVTRRVALARDDVRVRDDDAGRRDEAAALLDAVARLRPRPSRSTRRTRARRPRATPSPRRRPASAAT